MRILAKAIDPISLGPSIYVLWNKLLQTNIRIQPCPTLPFAALIRKYAGLHRGAPGAWCGGYQPSQ
ncbi:hypothetical protein A2U01_0056920 [Trifolium medium]|uniref:Uncharacterized protein n=1 Tax=Trifolium medium TaxID=97028 RepID=A0A392RHH1_9FABA|nr:hypothetical protein [Trifolium medium]